MLGFVAGLALLAQGQALSATELRLRDWIDAHHEEQIAYLARVVNIPSGTMNLAGVRKTGEVFRATLDSLGFTTRWVAQDAVHRAGHLIAEHLGKPGTPTILLIGHFDTVFEGPGTEWQRAGTDSTARGAGSVDMKGGDVVMVYALKALASAERLKDANIIIVFSGDEERAGEPVSISRRDLTDAGRRADYALAFEGGNERSAAAARRGSSTWKLEVTARQAHSAGVFRGNYGAIYEAARIINAFRERLAGQPNLTFNPGIFVGGTDVTMDSSGVSATVGGKSNIISPHTIVTGDLRFITEGQKDSARAVMQEIASQSLPGTTAKITFLDAYPAMPPTDAGARLVAAYSDVSVGLGYRPITLEDPANRGAGDISFIAPSVAAAFDGLGAVGSGSHSPEERVNLNSVVRQTERAAVLLSRLISETKGPPKP